MLNFSCYVLFCFSILMGILFAKRRLGLSQTANMTKRMSDIIGIVAGPVIDRKKIIEGMRRTRLHYRIKLPVVQ